MKHKRFVQSIDKGLTLEGLYGHRYFCGEATLDLSTQIGEFEQPQKMILPKDVNRERLIYRNPALLDTRNLEQTPLKNFRTMGDSNYSVDLNDWRLEVTGRVGTPLRLTYSQILTLISAAMIALAVLTGYGLSQADNTDVSMAVFFVG